MNNMFYMRTPPNWRLYYFIKNEGFDIQVPYKQYVVITRHFVNDLNDWDMMGLQEGQAKGMIGCVVRM